MNHQQHATATTSTTKTPGAPCWVSLMARDLGASQAFYGAVLGWEFHRGGLGEEFSVAVLDGSPVAGIGALAPRLRVAVAWTPYFATPDADVASARIRERSGTVAVGPLAFSLGRGALAADRDGAVFGIWEGALIPDWQSGHKDAPAWLHLRARNAFDSAIFYGEVLDWASGLPGCCEVGYENDEVVLMSHGHVLARLSSGATGTAPDPLLRPRWDVHFPVDDVAATVRAVETNGGIVLERRTTFEGAEEAALRDPDGALFTVTGRI
ncbi:MULTISPECIES: VOC family protein [Streptomyces]|uniref:VOC family protein n=1 Tax=Streptomyces tsukubensis (strain DSM 42081 / NBRC 108919 / NRRL 18488 / 9993) TaxID=1114943 RepID=I2NBB8_STRT9|nr:MULTISPECIES: VOC family protein [Streptomyces]AZK98051.1 bleomycin resistance protein [Streptomyces tsukubensis]EIF94315.1 hydroxylase [Streptomyces tsukubensis NRRL18488]MYS66189.1 VOC family protein [Streptomyces sp. SID5473]QKM66028.1 VOC family protein [Streptomyces tsukubensis NRRL18488]TAI42308.1 VOC family protein [Streptomyces tsukubensis]